MTVFNAIRQTGNVYRPFYKCVWCGDVTTDTPKCGLALCDRCGGATEHVQIDWQTIRDAAHNILTI